MKNWKKILFGSYENYAEDIVDEIDDPEPKEELPKTIKLYWCSNPKIKTTDESSLLKLGDVFYGISGKDVGEEFVISDIKATKNSLNYYRSCGGEYDSGTIILKNIKDGSTFDLDIYSTDIYGFDYNLIIEDAYCAEDCLYKYKNYIEANKNFQVNFKIKKEEGSGHISIWYNTNHPDYRDWVAIKSKVDQCGRCDGVYVFESEEDAQDVINWFQDPNELERLKQFVACEGKFQRRWLDV
jgi:hypothetical protein